MQVFLIVVACVVIGILVDEGRQSDGRMVEKAKAKAKANEEKTKNYFVAKRLGFFAARIVAKYF